jgi:ubiquinone/menaquinone biosynthesis C-methylase UbiE
VGLTDRYSSRYRLVREIEFEAISKKLTQTKLSSAALILDVGTGKGIQTELFERFFPGAEIISIDIVGQAGENHPTVIASCENAPFRTGTFQVCFSSCVIEHIRNKKLGLEEMARVTSTGGLIVGIIPSVAWKLYQLSFAFVDFLFKHDATSSSPVEHGTSPSRLRRFPRNMIHGEFNSNLAEVRQYTTRSWMRLFEEADVKVVSNSYLDLAYSPDTLVTLLTKRLPSFLSSSVIIIGIKRIRD